MTEREFFIEKIGEEIPPFERVFRALPEDKIHHTHHPKSKTAQDLMHQMVDEAESFHTFFTTGRVTWGAPADKFTTIEDMTKRFSEAMQVAKADASNMTEEEWGSDAVASVGGHDVWTTTRGKMAWGLLFDLVHHRGQLSTYIRPMGGKVPSIYGPSGDDQGQ
jgi:uncharacterized damage-inducible protein DinB